MTNMKAIICISVLVFSLSNPAQAGDRKESSTVADDTLLLKANKKPTPGIHVYDANGIHIGLLVAYGAGMGWITVYVFDVKSIVQFSLFTGEVTGVPLFYESNDCSGEPLLSARAINAILQNHGKYYTGNKTEFASRNVFSMNSDNGGCESNIYFLPTAPAVEVSTQSLGFATPIALPLTFNAKIVPVGK